MRKGSSNKCKGRLSVNIIPQDIKILLLLVCIGIVLHNASLPLQAEEYEYDALNRVTKVTYEDGSYVEYAYDNNGNILNVNVYNAGPTPTPAPTPDGGQSGGDTGNAPDEETGETIPGESGEGESGTDIVPTEQPPESEGGTGDSGQEESEKSAVSEFFEQIIDAVKDFFNAIGQWFKSWF